MNNFDVLTLVSTDKTDYFDIQEDELKNILKEYELENHFETVKEWYNGYNFGRLNSIYNPWSILSWLKNPSHDFKTYWINTSNNADILLYLRNKNFPGYIFELKVYKPRKKLRSVPANTITRLCNIAFKQIVERNYISEFHSRKIHKVTKIAMIFYGKKVWMKEYIS